MLELGLLTEDGWNKTIEFTSIVNDTVDELTAPTVAFSAKSDEVVESKKIEEDLISDYLRTHNTIGFNQSNTVKKNARKIGTYFWYL